MIKININKAKTIAHDMRRSARELEFAPLDQLIAKQIPSNKPEELEAKRQAIRDKFAVIQDRINAAQTVEELRAEVELFNRKPEIK